MLGNRRVWFLNNDESDGLGVISTEPFMGTLKPQSNGPLYSSTVIRTLAVDVWAVTFGTASSGLGGLRPRPNPSSLYQM